MLAFLFKYFFRLLIQIRNTQHLTWTNQVCIFEHWLFTCFFNVRYYTFVKLAYSIIKITPIRNESDERISKLNNQPKFSFFRLYVD
jgi:hypothetical protein